MFSSVQPELPIWKPTDDQDFIFTQMRINDELDLQLAAAERRNISAVLSGPLLRRKEVTLLNP